MSKFEVGDYLLTRFKDKVLITGIEPYRYSITWLDKKEDDSILIHYVDTYWTKLESHKNQIIDQMNNEVTLSPEEIWQPSISTEVKETICIHTWRHITLFTSTVEECSKCGKLRDE